MLHHLEVPANGLTVLTVLFEKDGYFHIGLYSTYARRHIDAARELLLSNGFRPQLDDMNATRKMIERLPHDDPRRSIIYANDFFNTSGFRDLIFHAQERTYTLLEIEELITHAGLKFLGFEFRDQKIIDEYIKLYPNDSDCTNLNNWHEFEENNKDTFLGMHMFWCQKKIT